MSGPISGWARKTRGHRSPGQKLVLMLLAENADDGGKAWPSIATLAEDADMTPRSVINALNDMERRMRIIGRKSHGNQHAPTVYQLYVRPISEEAAQCRSTVARCAKRMSVGNESSSRQPFGTDGHVAPAVSN